MKEEALRWGGGSGGRAGAGGEDFRDFVEHAIAAAYVEHGAHQVADHVVEKAVAADAIDEDFPVLRVALLPGGGEDGADGALLSGGRWFYEGRRIGRGFRVFLVSESGYAVAVVQVGVGGREAEEVVLAFEVAGRALQQIQVHGPGAGVDIASQEGRADAFAEDAILVGFCHCRVARMKGASHGSRFQNANGGGECPIEGELQIFRGNVGGEFEAGYLAEGVDAGIGAAGALGQWGFAGDAAEGGLQFSLDGGLTGLDLPAAEVGAVVGEGQLPGMKPEGMRLGSFG